MRGTPEPEGAAASPNLKADPAPIVAPKPEIVIPVPPPVVAAPVAGTGPAPSAGVREADVRAALATLAHDSMAYGAHVATVDQIASMASTAAATSCRPRMPSPENGLAGTPS